MEEISADQLASELYQQGVTSFERGNYQQSISLLERARELAIVETNLGGEILVWLANAYDANGRTEEAIAICRSLKKHPTNSIRKSARYMLGIFTAIPLSKLQGVVSEVPVLESPDSYQSKPLRSKGLGGANQKPFREVPLEKPSTSNDDSFLWFAIAVTVAFLLLWAWK
ncbi:MAG: tetratricopeptide repeat protein [Pseudanabaena sp.]|jgi:tetratricopeptide (TPR) repeat protein|nr:tetratricopeptide repeat protein [Pseudanabaena sp. M53BS1SP1A06MG]MCA6585320.1 tetratricopeptide repeat protein [Pseudanabaena sp. M051S1SP1A06QC]MCA6591436.1 tetratricopeptide repeat protein [Pseudanabaena sp. M38BS1SP1A06MG]MCA6595037.1 tetratricopeptide repeat protein [Pseudanabaena sp. M046S1SP1A06QC]MCA6599284.1 tetratricopeptide repeat protein [Pseudanabaena sp. M57BS1SP1A06MG]MCA6603359.1 tetratricopeptide repeat protein [Pseudanabaena sp. M007S1SP1A06QC]MCA6613954.1 tetratricopept